MIKKKPEALSSKNMYLQIMVPRDLNIRKKFSGKYIVLKLEVFLAILISLSALMIVHCEINQ